MVAEFGVAALVERWSGLEAVGGPVEDVVDQPATGRVQDTVGEQDSRDAEARAPHRILDAGADARGRQDHTQARRPTSVTTSRTNGRAGGFRRLAPVAEQCPGAEQRRQRGDGQGLYPTPPRLPSLFGERGRREGLAPGFNGLR